MAVLSKGNTFATGDSPTATTLNNLVDNATFVSGAVDNSTTQLSGGAIIVKDAGITPAKLSTGGPSWTTTGAVSATSITNTPIGAATPSTGSFTDLTASGQTTVAEVVEGISPQASAPTGTLNISCNVRAVYFYTTEAAANFTFNFRGDIAQSLDAKMAVNQAITVAILITNGTTAYYCTGITIDGGAVTPKWQGGSAPTAGNASSTDCYTFTVIKTASATFSVFAAQTRFA